MAKYISNRNGGKTDEQGHYRFHVNAWDGNILNDGLKVKQNSPLGMSVLIEPGDVKIDYSTYGYTGWNDADEAVTIATADGSNPRIDRIVAYVDRVMTPNPSNSNNPGMLKFMSVAGTPAGSPSPVSDSAVNTAVSSNPWCELAQVRVNASVSTITNGSITDKRTIATPKLADGAVTPEKLITGTGTSWDWQGWTPALTAATTNPNIGSTGVIDGRYRQIGKTVDFELRISSSGSGLSNGSGNYRISYPVTPNNNYIGGNSPKIVGLVNFYNASNTTMYQAKAMAASTSYMEVYFDVASSTNLFTNSSNIWSSSFFGVPTGNIVTITGRYEAD